IVRRRKRASSASPRRVTSTPSTVIEPPLGVSSPASRPSSVDLPLPDGPVTATTSPAAISRLTPSRIVSDRPPLGSRITRSRTEIMGSYYRGDVAALFRRADSGLAGLRLAGLGAGRGAGRARDRRVRRQPHRRPGHHRRRRLPRAAGGAPAAGGLRLPSRERRRERG